MSGKVASGTSSFNCQDSTVEILSSSDYYSQAPMIYVTNTAAEINLDNCQFTFGSGIFLNVAEGDWGKSGSNGGTVTMNLEDQTITGDIVVDSYSSLTLNLVNSKITGKINSANSASKLIITLDEDSTITLTGNSYYTSISNSKADGSNLVNGSYTWNDNSNGSRNQNLNIKVLILIFALMLIMLS